MKKGILCIVMACMAGLAEAQYIPAFRTDTAEVKDPGKEYWSEKTPSSIWRCRLRWVLLVWVSMSLPPFVSTFRSDWAMIICHLSS